MSTITTARILLKNTWFLTNKGFEKGFVFLYGSKIEDTGSEVNPEYEFSELVYDFEYQAVITHGYSLLVDLVEYTTRQLGDIDLSVLTRSELKKLAEVGVVNAYTNGITLPVTITKYPEVVSDIARENSIRIGLIVERNTVVRNPYISLLEVDEGWIYYGDQKLIEYKDLTCKPGMLHDKCVLIDARGYGNLVTAIEETYRGNNPLLSYNKLTGLYRVLGVDNGFVEKGSASDLVLFDLRNPLKSAPVSDEKRLYNILVRAQQPDIVFIGGEIFYEFGENLAIPLVKIGEILKKIK